MIIAQISDPHIRAEGHLAYRRVETADFLARCVEQLRRMMPAPDVVLATGDLVDFGRRDEYERLRHLLTPLAMPVYLIPGNHDDRDVLREAFPHHRYLPSGAARLHYVVDDHPVRLVALDTLIPGQGGGVIDADGLRWLDARLAEAPRRPTIIFMHHPPFLTGIRRMDAQGLAGAEAMAAVVVRHAQVERVLCGHLHRAIQARWAGTVASTAPSTAHQVALELRDGAPLGFTFEPPAYQVHLWRAETGVVSHTACVGEFAGPYPFREGGKLID